MTPDTYAVCQQIAEEIVKGSRHLAVPIFRGANHPIDRGYLIDDTARILRSHTSLPKLVILLAMIKDEDDKSQYPVQGGGAISNMIKGFFTDLQGDKPTTEKLKE